MVCTVSSLSFSTAEPMVFLGKAFLEIYGGVVCLQGLPY
jgi:hypothetical protein